MSLEGLNEHRRSRISRPSRPGAAAVPPAAGGKPPSPSPSPSSSGWCGASELLGAADPARQAASCTSHHHPGASSTHGEKWALPGTAAGKPGRTEHATATHMLVPGPCSTGGGVGGGGPAVLGKRECPHCTAPHAPKLPPASAAAATAPMPQGREGAQGPGRARRRTPHLLKTPETFLY